MWAEVRLDLNAPTDILMHWLPCTSSYSHFENDDLRHIYLLSLNKFAESDVRERDRDEAQKTDDEDRIPEVIYQPMSIEMIEVKEVFSNGSTYKEDNNPPHELK